METHIRNIVSQEWLPRLDIDIIHHVADKLLELRVSVLPVNNLSRLIFGMPVSCFISPASGHRLPFTQSRNSIVVAVANPFM